MQGTVTTSLIGLGVVAIVVIVAMATAIRFVREPGGLWTTVYDFEHALLYVDGRFERLLPPGRHLTAWFSRHDVYRLSRSELVEHVGPVDVISADKLVFRLSAVVWFRIADPQAAFVEDYRQKVRLAISSALQSLAGERSVETLLAGRAALDEALKAALPPSLAGCEIGQAAVTAVSLPPELRRLFSEVERARLEGQAALERARGEQAALRALANAARMLKDNPELQNLRLLQTLSGSGRSQPTIVLGEGALKPPVPRAPGPA